MKKTQKTEKNKYRPSAQSAQSAQRGLLSRIHPRRVRERTARTADLNAADLQQRALRNIKHIALLTLILILLDLAVSLTGGNVRILRDDGGLYLVRPAAGEDAGHITLDALVHSGSRTYEKRFDIRLDPRQDTSDDAPEATDAARETSGEDLIRSELRSLGTGFNEDLSASRVLLPSRLDSGEAVHWKKARTTNSFLLALTGGALMLLVYRSRFRPLQKKEQARRQSVLRQLPSFLNELVLLLNAGLVLSRAFELAAERTARDGDQDYFRRNIRSICHSMRNTNAAMHEEFHQFARSSGVSELMRVSGILRDNISKGAELNVKLERESQRLWLARKLDAEERGRLAETKMTLPLSIFLCVVIIITVSPALLQL